MTRIKLTTLTAILLAALLPRLGLADELTDRAQSLIDQGKAPEAFTLLDPQEGARAGEVAFDLLLGIAAVDSGQHTRAVFALERVLAVQPNNARARAEIARAYLALGETTAAKQEFENVQKQGVPSEVSATIDRYLDAVDRIDSATRTTVRGYAEASLGYDNNINAATGKGSIAVPAFGGIPFTLASNSRAQSAWYGALGGGINIRSPINSDVALVGGASGLLRDNFDSRPFDSLNADAYAGVVLTRDKNVFSLNAQYNQYDQASDQYRTAAGFSGQWQYNLNSNNQFSLFTQYSNLRYQGQSVRNADRWVAGGAYAHAYRGGEVVFASAYWVNEKPHEGNVNWLGFDGTGIRLGGQMNLTPKIEFFALGSIEYRRYDDPDPSFLSTRRDTQYDMTIGLNYKPSRLWQVIPKFAWTQNDSNLDINKYHREAVSVTVRRAF